MNEEAICSNDESVEYYTATTKLSICLMYPKESRSCWKFSVFCLLFLNTFLLVDDGLWRSNLLRRTVRGWWSACAYGKGRSHRQAERWINLSPARRTCKNGCGLSWFLYCALPFIMSSFLLKGYHQTYWGALPYRHIWSLLLCTKPPATTTRICCVSHGSQQRSNRHYRHESEEGSLQSHTGRQFFHLQANSSSKGTHFLSKEDKKGGGSSCCHYRS